MIMMPLQTTFDIVNMTEGQALFIVGVLAMLLAAAITMRNPAALVGWALSLMLLVLVTVLDMGSEWLWVSILVTAILLVIGAAVRWTR